MRIPEEVGSGQGPVVPELIIVGTWQVLLLLGVFGTNTRS